MKPIQAFDTCERGYTFGVPTSYSSFHLGTDFIIPVGTPLYAVKRGVVKRYTLADTGNMIELHTGDYVFRYMHLSQFMVSTDQTVSEGALIGYSGNTGESTGPHLHFDISKGNTVQVSNHANFLDPATFNYTTMRYLSAFKNQHDATVYGIVAFDTPDELHAAGFTSNDQIHSVDSGRLLKQEGSDPVYLSFHNPAAGFELPFTGGVLPVEEYASLDLQALNAQDSASLQTKIDKAKADLA